MPDAPYLSAAAAVDLDERLADFDAAAIAHQVAVFEGIVEPNFGVAYTPRTAVETFDRGWPACSLSLQHTRVRSITTVTISGVPVPASGYSLNALAGIITNLAGWSSDSLEVAYLHGWDAPPPVLLEACTEYVRSVLKYKASGTNRNTIAQGGEGSATRYSTPDPANQRWTGWLEVDRLLGHLIDERIPVA